MHHRYGNYRFCASTRCPSNLDCSPLLGAPINLSGFCHNLSLNSGVTAAKPLRNSCCDIAKTFLNRNGSRYQSSNWKREDRCRCRCDSTELRKSFHCKASKFEMRNESRLLSSQFLGFF